MTCGRRCYFPYNLTAHPEFWMGGIFHIYIYEIRKWLTIRPLKVQIWLLNCSSIIRLWLYVCVSLCLNMWVNNFVCFCVWLYVMYVSVSVYMLCFSPCTLRCQINRGGGSQINKGNYKFWNISCLIIFLQLPLEELQICWDQ